ncbi:MAG: SRPBCC family protein [Paracoccaceae bacterium]
MKFSSREDIEAPIGAVYDTVTDFDRFERQLLRRGVEIARDESCAPTEVGARWQAKFAWRGRSHLVDAEMIAIDPDTGFSIESKSGGVICMGVVDLVPLSTKRTRLFASLDLRPTTLSSRLFIQSMKLAKGTLNRKFKTRVAEFASRIEG